MSRAFPLLLSLMVILLAVAQYKLEYPKPVFTAKLTTVAPANPIENEEVLVRVEVGRESVAGPCTLRLRVDNQEIKKEVKVRSTRREFYFTLNLPSGYHTLALDNRQLSIYVSSEELGEANIRVESFEIEPKSLKLWEEAYIVVKLKNLSDSAGKRTVRVWIDNQELQKDVVVPAGITKYVYFPFTPDKLQFRIRVENLENNVRLGLANIL
jgi:hypothetical protein